MTAILIAQPQAARAEDSASCAAARARSEKIFNTLTQTAIELKKIKRFLPLNFECGLSFNAQADLDGVKFSEAYTSILSDEELAAVLAHEIAHEYTFNAPADENSRTVFAAPTEEDPYANESNADVNGIYLMHAAGFNANASVTALEKIVAADGDTDDHFHLQLTERKMLLQKTVSALK